MEEARRASPASADGVPASLLQPMLCVSDNGCGMSHKDVLQMLSLGHELPPSQETQRIGRFGVGFKVTRLHVSFHPFCVIPHLLASHAHFL